jgi:hypothetical protein
MGKFLVSLLVVSAVLAGAAMYYLQVYAFYDEVPSVGVGDVQLTTLSEGTPEPIVSENFKAIDAQSSPLRYRACFETPLTEAELAATYATYENPVPNVAPRWFDCFDAKALGAKLEAGEARAFLGTANIHYGFDRVVAVDGAGRGFVWHQMNPCGQAFFDGDPLPEGCPPPPEATE